MHYTSILLTKITATQNEVAFSYGRVRGLYFLAVIHAATIYNIIYIPIKVLFIEVKVKVIPWALAKSN